MKRAICFFEVQPGERAFLRRFRAAGHDIRLFNGLAGAASAEDLRDAAVISTFIYSRVDAAVLRRAPALKLVTTRSTGFDHIDGKACRRRGVAVANVPVYGENTVAEHTFALVLALSRRLHQAQNSISRGDFSFEGLQGFDLKGKTIGIVGTGNIGIHAIRIARGFAMDVLAFDVVRNQVLAETLGFRYTDLPTLLRQSDIVSLHVPHRPETHHLLNRGTIGKMKKGALLINTARGGLVDTAALARALDSGALAGAGLDVLEEEGSLRDGGLRDHVLFNRENVIITPHIGFNSREASLRILQTTAESIRAFLAGKPENLVGVR